MWWFLCSVPSGYLNRVKVPNHKLIILMHRLRWLKHGLNVREDLIFFLSLYYWQTHWRKNIERDPHWHYIISCNFVVHNIEWHWSCLTEPASNFASNLWFLGVTNTHTVAATNTHTVELISNGVWMDVKHLNVSPHMRMSMYQCGLPLHNDKYHEEVR